MLSSACVQMADENGEWIKSEESKPHSDGRAAPTAPRLERSRLFPYRGESDEVTRMRAPVNLYVQETSDGQVQHLRMITPYER